MKIANADKLKKHFESVVDVKLFTVPNILTIIETFSSEVVEPPMSWFPIRYRDMTEEEIEEMIERYDVVVVDKYQDCWAFDCVLPEDAQDVLVCTKCGDVVLDTFNVDEGCWFGNYPDRDDLIAWMPLPAPYKVGGTEP